MTVTVAAETVSARVRGTRRALVALEARRAITAPWPWLGVALSTWFAYTSSSTSFAGGGYHNLMASFAGVASGLFVLAVDAGSRDRALGAPLAPDAAIDADARALARLLGLWPSFTIAVLFACVVFAVQRVDGGMWVADLPVGGNEAVFSIVEMLQPMMLFAVVLAAGVALGRWSSHPAAVAMAGALVITTTGLGYWAWQWTPAVWVTLIQTQPIEVRLGDGFAPADAPSTWQLSAPDTYGSGWGRILLHEAMAGWHLVYLAGLAAAFAGLAIRGRRGRTAAVTGAAVAIGAVVAQIIVTPAGIAGA